MKFEPYSIPNVLRAPDQNKFFTKNLVPGSKVYNEDLIDFEDNEYRFWNPHRSKLAALLLKKTEQLELAINNTMLYLGAAAGTTASHLSDILQNGRIYCVEFSARPFRDLVKLSEQRPNMIPILANARIPAEYRAVVEGVDWLYQDISQRDQVEIFIKNMEIFLKPAGRGIIMVKSRSIDVNLEPNLIYQTVHRQLESGGFKVLEMKVLTPFQKDHAAFIVNQR
ncbi:MAG: fibrillarin-like rRNA/tRNA 2'-O-methyltransferase [Thermoplasmata archaeon]|nr:MAG: fibrillarin-like rRNA/tRNA 2'-O-methyltransferase [Thermoplasmata archaeon]